MSHKSSQHPTQKMYLEPGIKINAFSLKNGVGVSVVSLLTWLLGKVFFKTDFQLFLAAMSLITIRNYLANGEK